MVKTRHHEGEQAVQKRAGEGHAGWGSPMFDDVIQLPLEDDPGPVRPAASSWADLGPRRQRWIAEADTFFIASRSPEHGADASHRGGEPGFVTVEGPRRLSWPDYVGNSFYMKLGTCISTPRAACSSRTGNGATPRS
ncbi:hypothetical protein [Microbispora bryophytorum]|uniref:Uncharacterized protein n=1 Tax=Microbispora bryophytorum subsp. camponoti TaxID=1677852 RepID=A0ABR8L3G6_9ACTN|nr:hypothetical protein [Microbispora camponoti]MBD3145492.1 hypothetical protein [Microbispora camponoti]